MEDITLAYRSGTKSRSFIEMETYAGPLKVRIPMLAAWGRTKRPLVTLTAAQHGREVQGIEVIRRVFEALDPGELKGSVVAFPVANPLSVPQWQQDYPSEMARYLRADAMSAATNLNRNWPGKLDGNLQAQMCHAMWHKAIRHSAFHVDLHGWTDNSLPLAWATETNRPALEAFSCPISMVNPGGAKTGGMLDNVCEMAGIPWLTVELTPQNRLCERSVQIGVRGVINLLKHLGLLDGQPELAPERHFITPKSVEHVFTAKGYGLVSPEAPIGAMLAKGQRFGTVTSLDTLEPMQELVAPAAGILFNIGVTLSEMYPSTSIAAPGMTVALVREIDETLRP